MDELLFKQLISDVANYLDITWSMSSTEKDKLTGMIRRGMDALSGKIGECDFLGETQERTLLFNYVMYDRAGALNDFWKNYSGEIISLQMDRWVKKNAESQQ